MDPSNKLKSWDEILNIVEKNREKKIVFTNGCFDILHAGHVAYLYDAKKMGDILIVGLNSDDSIHRLKGTARPVNHAHERAYVLGGLASVDYIVIFDEDTPLQLITLLKPNVLVKGGDWLPKNIVGFDFVTARGGTVMSLPFREGFSTSGTIGKIIESYRNEILGTNRIKDEKCKK